jgi:hypothetical protein
MAKTGKVTVIYNNIGEKKKKHKKKAKTLDSNHSGTFKSAKL